MPRSFPRFLAALLGVSLVTSAIHGQTLKAEPGDWPQWRGPQRDAISTETGLLKQWPKGGPPLLWDSNKVNGGKSVGTGIASLAIVQGKIYTMGDHFTDGKSGDEFVYCLNADNGKEIWKVKFGPAFFNGNGAGPRCTPTVEADRLYVLSPQGLLACLKTNDGATVWQKQMSKDFGGRMMSGWGYSESPTIDGNKLICTPGGEKAAVVALDKITGAVLWKCQVPANTGAGYASIVSAEVGGIKQYITLLGKELGLVGVDANTGKFLWNYKKAANGTANIPTAIVQGDLGGGLFKIPEELAGRPRFHLHGLRRRRRPLEALLRWKGRRQGRGGVLPAGQ